MKQISYNRTLRGISPKYIVIHDTGNRKNGADAEAHFNYFNSGNRDASADFFVDDKTALQVNDYTMYYTWHCGDGNGKYGIRNSNSLGIEICVNGDGNYDEAFKKTVALTRKLMKELSIPPENVVRHFDASDKICPASMSSNNWALWHKFKEQIKENITEPEDIVISLTNMIEILDKPSAIKAVAEEKTKNSSLYWILYKIVNL